MNSEKRNDVATRATLSDVATLRKQARSQIEDGAVTEGYALDAAKVCELLNDSLATELVCVLRYKRHYFMAKGLLSAPIAQEFLDHANEEQGHADSLAERIVQLGGAPDLNPDTLSKRSHAEYVEGSSLVDMIKENLVAERIAIDSYRELILYLGKDDPTTKRLIEEILSVEEEHADDMADLLHGLPETLANATKSAARPVR